MSSYIPTTTAQATRNADVLTYKGDDGNLGGVGSELKGTVACKVLLPNKDVLVQRNILSLSDGGSGVQNIDCFVATNEKFGIFVISGGDNGISVIGSIADNEVHNVRGRWQTDSVISTVDGENGTEDTSCDIPDDLDEIDVGMAANNAGQLNGIISDVKIYRKPILK